MEPGSSNTVVTDGLPPELSQREVLLAVVRRGGPRLLEASFIPAALFYVCLVWGGLGLAYAVALAWVYGCLLWRLMQRKRIPPVLVLGILGITVRTLVAVGSGSSFMYFVQPILGTLATGGIFALSLVVGRPLIGRLAHDFWEITPEMEDNPRVASLFRGLTVLWAVVNLATATITLCLLLWLPLTTFVVVKQFSGTGVTVAAIAVTIVWSHRTACREGIVRAPVRGAATSPG